MDTNECEEKQTADERRFTQITNPRVTETTPENLSASVCVNPRLFLSFVFASVRGLKQR
jgi:hypothetical protein